MNPLRPNRSFTLSIRGITFHGEIPTPGEDIQIDVAVSKRIGGVPIDSLPLETYQYAIIVETLQRVIRFAPPDFSVKDWGEIHDTEFVFEIYAEYAKKKTAFYEELKKNKHHGRTQERINHDGSVDHSQVRGDAGRQSSERSVSRPEEISDAGTGMVPGLQQHSGSRKGYPASKNVKVHGRDKSHGSGRGFYADQRRH